MGFLLYAICHLQNRLQCKFNDAVFESLMQYFRVSNLGDAERAIKVDLTDKTPLPDGLNFVPSNERWQVNEKLVDMLMGMNRNMMDENSAGYIADTEGTGSPEETATKTMSRINTSAALVSGMLNQSYSYKKFEYQEISRRACIKNSKDADVRKFRLNCLKAGVPEEALNVEKWDIVPVRVIGGGNKMLQQAMTDKIMTLYWNKLDPSAQREALQLGLAVTTDDYDLARRWVPDQPTVSSSVTAGQNAASTLMSALPMTLQEGVNHEEFLVELMKAMAAKIKQVEARGGMATPEEITGLQNVAGETVQGQPLPGNGVAAHLKILQGELESPYHIKGGQADEKSAKQKIKNYSDGLAKLMNEVKKLAQQSAEAAKAKPKQGAELDPETKGKITSQIILAQNKAKLAEKSHGARTAQKQISFEQNLEQQKQKHQLEMAQQVQEMQLKTLME